MAFSPHTFLVGFDPAPIGSAGGPAQGRAPLAGAWQRARADGGGKGMTRLSRSALQDERA